MGKSKDKDKKDKDKGKDKEKEKETGSSAACSPPEGCQPMMISMKNMDDYGLKTGDALKDTVKFKWFDKEWILGKSGWDYIEIHSSKVKPHLPITSASFSSD